MHAKHTRDAMTKIDWEDGSEVCNGDEMIGECIDYFVRILSAKPTKLMLTHCCNM